MWISNKIYFVLGGLLCFLAGILCKPRPLSFWSLWIDLILKWSSHSWFMSMVQMGLMVTWVDQMASGWLTQIFGMNHIHKCIWSHMWSLKYKWSYDIPLTVNVPVERALNALGTLLSWERTAIRLGTLSQSFFSFFFTKKMPKHLFYPQILLVDEHWVLCLQWLKKTEKM